MATTMAVAKTTLRVSPEDLATIDARARAHGLSRTSFLVSLGVGRDLPLTDAAGLKDRVDVLERRADAARRDLEVLGFEETA